MMRFARSAVVCWIVLGPCAVRAIAADISVRALVDRDQVAVGETLTLTVEISGAQNVPAPNLGDVSAFNAQYLGPATQVSIVNGQVSARISHRYALTARKAGRFTIGPVQVEHEGQTFRTNAINVDVSAQARAPAGRSFAAGDEELRLTVTPAKERVYVGERVSLTLKLYVGNVHVDQLQYPEIPGEGFSLEKYDEPQRRHEIVGQKRYQVLEFHTVLTPLRAGDLQIGPAMMAMNVVRSRGRGGTFDDPFFDQFFGRRQALEVTADPVTLTVLPLPSEGRPADFSGAVGEFRFALEAKPTELAAGDPITLRIEIDGQGNLESLVPPAIAADDRFRMYDPTELKVEQRPGRRVFEQVVIPREAGLTELPPVRFTYFDPNAASYRMIVRGPISLVVHAAASAVEPKVVGEEEVKPTRREEKLGRDIVYIKDAPGTFRLRGQTMNASVWALVVMLPPLACLVLFASIRRRERLRADPRLVRFRQAGSQARRLLKRLNREPADGKVLFDEVCAALRGYLAAKLDLPPGGVERQRVLEALRANGTPDELRRRVDELFQLIEGARYAPSEADAAQRDAILELAREIVEGMERERGLAHRLGAAALLVFALLSAASVAARPPRSGEAGATAGVSDPHTLFYRANSAYRDGEYEQSLREYEEILAAGWQSGPLHFNLGNANFKLGRLGEAILSYERARRLLPRDPDVRANLAYARELAEETAEESPLWASLLFPMAERLTTRDLVLSSGLLWWVLWLLLGLQLFVRVARPALKRATVAALVLFTVFSASLAWRIWEHAIPEAAVVTASGETSVRFEPSATGTEHFSLREGALVTVTERRKDWLQIRRHDGRRGWIPAGAVASIR